MKKIFSFSENTNCNNLIVDVTFISIPWCSLIILKKYSKFSHLYKSYFKCELSNEFYKDKEKDIFKMAKNITEGCNPNEISLIQKPLKNKGFFEKFFHFFN